MVPPLFPLSYQEPAPSDPIHTCPNPQKSLDHDRRLQPENSTKGKLNKARVRDATLAYAMKLMLS